ncbi:MAG: hypothetical protein ACXACF_10000, partial [Candidatus Hermodarchaeia archaeon]
SQRIGRCVFFGTGEQIEVCLRPIPEGDFRYLLSYIEFMIIKPHRQMPLCSHGLHRAAGCISHVVRRPHCRFTQNIFPGFYPMCHSEESLLEPLFRIQAKIHKPIALYV